jgi:Zn-dependent M28 family amino/carboxypeptidase
LRQNEQYNKFSFFFYFFTEINLKGSKKYIKRPKQQENIVKGAGAQYTLSLNSNSKYVLDILNLTAALDYIP